MTLGSALLRSAMRGATRSAQADASTIRSHRRPSTSTRVFAGHAERRGVPAPRRPDDRLRACRLSRGEEFAARQTGIAHFEVRTLEDLERRAHEADVLVVSGLWRNTLLASAPKLRFVQSLSAGTDQYDKALFAKHGVRLANAQGANERAVAEHAMALILALTRQLHQARDNQQARQWRGMIGDRALREQELGGKTLVIVGLGRIGMRLAALGAGVRHAGDRRAPHGEARA